MPTLNGRSFSLFLVISCALPLHSAPVQITRAADRITFSSDQLVAEFVTQKHGGLVALRAARGGRNLLVPVGQWFGARLWGPKGGGVREIGVGSHEARTLHCTARQDGDEVVLEVKASDFPEKSGIDLTGLQLSATVRLGPRDEALRWRFAADVPSTLRLQRFEGPLVQVAAPLGESGEDDAVVIGHPKGGVAPQPHRWKNGRSVGGVLSAQFGCVYDAAGGIMTMACDGEGYEKQLYGSRTKGGLLLAWRQAVTGTGQVATPYDTLVRPFAAARPDRPTDWRDAADIYRAWALTQHWCTKRFQDRPDVADWMKTGPTHVRFSRNWLAEPELVERWLERYWDPHFAGVPLVVTFWGWEHHGSWVAPDYFPPYPSAEAFTKLVKAIRKRQGHVFLWPSGYHWTVSYEEQKDGSFAWDDRERFAKEGAPHVSLDAKGKPRVGKRSWLRGGRNASMCPGDPWTQQWLADIFRGCLDTGADMVQVDQVVRGAFPDCFSDQHGHAPGGGLWKTRAMEKQLRGLLALGKSRTPEFVLGIEEPQEWFNHLVGIQDYRDFQIATRHGRVPGHRPASIYGYVYHDFLPVFQSNPRANDAVGQAYCLVTGQIPHLVPSQRVCYDSLLLNGEFEDWDGDVPRHWSKVSGWQGKVWKGSCRPDTVAPGSSCLLLENKAGETVQVSQNIPVSRSGLVVGKEYRLKVKLRTAGLQPGNHLNFAAFAPGLKSLGGWHVPLPITTDGKWQQASVPFTMPPGSSMLRIMLHVNGEGRVWLDGMTIDTAAAKAAEPVVALPSDHDIMQQWSRLFHGEGRPWLLHGQMIHPPRLDTASIEYGKISLPAVFHNAFRSAAGREAVILVNATPLPQSATLHGEANQKLSMKPYEVRLLKH
ncbi:MAG: hypothetical protein HN904_17735 [Victivallales bacterium]|nr:hypothetical protein [Victivallales bacterium]